MADDYLPSFFSTDPKSGFLTYPQLQARRQIAAALATRNRPYPKTIGEGLTALGEGIGEGYNLSRLDAAEAMQAARDKAGGQSILPGGAVAPAAPARPAPGGASLDGDTATSSFAMAPTDTTAETQQPSVVAQAPQQQPQMPVEEFKQRTARNWTPTEKDPYRAIIGPPNDRGDYGYGKYRIMGENVPLWTKQYLGTAMTPQQFLADDKAQEQLASARGGELLDKYGSNGAAAAWFGGEDGMKDQSRPYFQAHVAEYVKRFNIPLGDRDQIAASATSGERPIQLASLGGVPTPDTAPDVARDAVAQSLVAQQGVTPPPQQVAQAQPPLPLGARAVEPPVTNQGVRPIPKPPDNPYQPGPEPTPRSVITPDMAREILANQKVVNGVGYYSTELRQQAHDNLTRLQTEAKELFTTRHQDWKTTSDKAKEYELNRQEKALGLEKGTLEAEKARRELEGEGAIPLPPEKLKEFLAASGGSLPAGQTIWQTRRGELKFGPAPPTQITIDQKQEAASKQAMGRAIGEYFGETFKDGATASTDLETITRLRELQGNLTSTGASATVQKFLGDYGIKTEGLSTVQAYSALINKLTPQQRVPGAGQSSDFDARMFRDSLPRLVNTPEGNRLIMDTMEKLALNRMARADIAGEVATGAITEKEGLTKLRELGLQARAHSDAVKAHLEQQDKAGGVGGTSTIGPGTIQENKVTKERRIMRPDGSWESLPSGQ